MEWCLTLWALALSTVGILAYNVPVTHRHACDKEIFWRGDFG